MELHYPTDFGDDYDFNSSVREQVRVRPTMIGNFRDGDAGLGVAAMGRRKSLGPESSWPAENHDTEKEKKASAKERSGRHRLKNKACGCTRNNGFDTGAARRAQSLSGM
jgi:hypothetical protein